MSSLSNLESGASKTVNNHPPYEVTDPHLDAPLTTAINAISAAGSAQLEDADRSSSTFTSAESPSPSEDLAEEALPELELIPETHLFGRLPFLFQSVAYQHHLDLDRAYSIYEKIPQDQIPQEIKGLAKTLENLVTIKKFLIARDKLIVWQKVAHRSRLNDDIPHFAELNSLDDYLTKAAEFGDWLDQKPQARGITKLKVEDAQLSSIPPEVSKLTQLQLLDLSINQIQKIEGLEPLTQLQRLDLSVNQIQKLEGLETLTQLQRLFLGDNQIEKLEGLETLTQLETLHLSSNQIQKVEGLETLTQLQELYLDYNEIQKLEGLDNLTQLEELWLSCNQIQKLEGLEALTQLQRLFLGVNQIEKLEGIEALTQLQELFLGVNQIEKLEGLEALTQLQELYLDSNQIQRIEGLENLTQLRHLYLDSNQIQRREGVEHLPRLTLDLTGNPVNSRYGCNIL